MKSLTGGLIFRHSSCSERAPTGVANRDGEDLEHQPACVCTTARVPRLLESSLRKKSGESEISPNKVVNEDFFPEFTCGCQAIPAAGASPSRSLWRRCGAQPSLCRRWFAREGRRQRHQAVARRSFASRAGHVSSTCRPGPAEDLQG